jgi:hypothetical protein
MPLALKDFILMKMSKLSKLNTQENFGLPAERVLSRASLVLSLIRLISGKHCLLLLIRKISLLVFLIFLPLLPLVHRRGEAGKGRRITGVFFQG